MPQKTIYLSSDDLAIWEQAQKEIGESMSAIVSKCLKERLNIAKEAAQAAERIEVEVRRRYAAPRKKAFKGEWIVGDHSLGVPPENTDPTISYEVNSQYSLARSAKGKLVVYTFTDDYADLNVYENFDELKSSCVDDAGLYQRYPDNVISAFAAGLDEDFVEELDI